MKAISDRNALPQPHARPLARALVGAGLLFLAVSGFAQPMLPPNPNVLLNTWSFEDTNWFSDLGYAPASFTNIDNVPSFDGNGLQVDSTNPAWLNYHVVESGGITNLTFNRGSIELWFKPNWNSASLDGGAGLGDWGRLIEVGSYTTNASASWWSLYFSPDGNSLNFSSETNGAGTNYLSYPIAWDSNTWHFVALTYLPFRSDLYVDGQLATNGGGVVYVPDATAISNGFFVGSDNMGGAQMHGQLDDMATYNYPLGAYEVTNDYVAGLQIMNGGGHTMDSGSGGPGLPGGGSGGDGGGGSYSPSYTPPNYGSNLWMALSGLVSNTMPLLVSNTQPDILYELQGRTNLVAGDWTSYGFFNGSELTNWTPASVWAGQPGNLFLRIRSWQDSNNSGIPDWWWLTYFGQITNVDANASAAGDGLSNLQKYQMGLNPTNYYNPNGVGGYVGCLNAAGTNVILMWSTAPGPVIGYAIQRGIQDTNGNYIYSPLATVSSNATLYVDVGANYTNAAQNYSYQLAAIYAGGSPSVTNTWYVWWYVNDGTYGMPYGPPVPGNVYANADVTGTNVMLSWTAASSTATNYLILHGIYNPSIYAYQYTQITNVSVTITNFEIFGALTHDSNWTEAYEVEAVYPGGGVSAPATTQPDWSSFSSINVGANTNGPAAPGNFYGYLDSTGTNIFLSWSPVSGAVTNYILYGGVFDNTTDLIIYHRLAKLGAATNSFEVVGAITNGNNLYYVYSVVAVYTNNSLSQSASWNPGSGAPAPGTLYAWLDATGTNVQLSWTAASGGVTGYLVQRNDYGIYYSWMFYEVGQVGAGTTSLVDTDAVDTGSFDPGSTVYEVQAMFPNGGLSAAVTAMVSNTPAAPSGLTATVDSTGTNVFLTWSPATGTATGYTIFRGTYNPSTGNYSYSQIGTTTGVGATSFEDIGAFSGGNDNNNVYEVEANYAGGSFSSPVSSGLYQPSTPPTYNLNVTAQMVRNQTGHWQLMFSSIPANVQKIAFYWYFWDYFYDFGASPDTIDFDSNGQPITTENDIPVSSITNGIYVLPDFLMTNWFPNNQLGKVAMIQPIGTNNQYGIISQVGFQPYDSPTFVDGRQHLKQNLLYQLRSATISQPNAPLSENGVWWDPWFQSESIPVDTNYVESSIFHWSLMFKGYNAYDVEYLKMDDVWPITVNYELHGGLYDPNFTGTAFNWQPNVGADFPTDLEFQGTLATIPAPAVLGVGDPYWIGQGLGNLADVAAYTNSGNLYLQSGYHNLYGLSFAAALVDTPGGWHINMLGQWENGSLTTLSPGGSVSEANVSTFYSQTVDPSLVLSNYYFAPVNTPGTALPNENTQIQPYPIPALRGFASTNKTGLMITSVGTPTTIGGWAKFSIQNSSKFAYLGQYYVTNAFVMTNGIVTTNTTGVVSPYGDFFPTQPGAVAMITMPDIDTGVQGTGVVRVVGMCGDANHDGILDPSYQGPDFTSPSRPLRFWVDDSQDSGDFGGTGVPGQGSQGNGVLPINGQYVVHGRRDLVNLFPVYLNIGSLFQSNALSAGISATDTNWQFVLSQADGALRFAYTSLTPTNYMNYLRDTNTSGNLAWWPGNPNYAVLTTVSNSGVTLSPSFIAGIATNNQGIILVQAWESTTQPLVLTIYHGTNQIAQTSLYLSISGVEQMFRYKNLLIGAATNQANLLPDRLTDASVPNEPDTIDKNVVWVHGYNVSPTAARGWFADIYKRLYWSGSHAKFYGVNWYGNDSQIGTTTPNYQVNVVHAFQTAPLLANFIATLTNGPTVVAAHSLGNMVTLSAISDWSAPISQYFMVDAAVATEAIDPSATINTNMVTFTSSMSWLNYNTALWASEWFNVWPTNDARSTLSWNGRLDNFGSTAVYNFYSSGEEVLRTSVGAPPPNLFSAIFSEIQQYIAGDSGTFAWAWQEKCKGLMSSLLGNPILSSDHGGWALNENLGSGYVFFVNGLRTNIPPAVITNSVLQTNAFFDMSYDTAMFTASSSGSTYAQTNRNRILSDAIPAVTLPIGANPVSRLQTTGRNFDMQSSYENGWPLGRGAPSWPAGTTAFGEWHHSDVRVVAYTFTYQLFNQMVTVGNLK